MDFTYKCVPIETLEFNDFCEYLRTLGTKKKADFDRKIINTDMELCGLYSAQIHDIVKYLKKTDCSQILAYPNNKVYEVTEIIGLLLVTDGTVAEGDYVKVRGWLEGIDNWGHVDTVMTKLRINKEERERAFSFATALIREDKEFFIRAGVVLMLGKYLTDEYIDRVLDELRKIDYGRYYYVDMAVAWLCATALIRYKNKTLDFLTNCEKINDFTYCKALQKAWESYRISDLDKLEYKIMLLERRDK